MDIFETFLYNKLIPIPFQETNKNRLHVMEKKYLRKILFRLREKNNTLNLKSLYMERLLNERLQLMRYDVFICLAHNKGGSIVGDRNGNMLGISKRIDDLSIESQLKDIGYSSKDILCVKLCIVPWENTITYDGVVEVLSPIVSTYAVEVVKSFKCMRTLDDKFVCWDLKDLKGYRSSECECELLEIEKEEIREGEKWKRESIERWIEENESYES